MQSTPKAGHACRCLWGVRLLHLLVLVGLSVQAISEPARDLEGDSPAAAEVRTFSDSTVVWQGDRRMVAFALAVEAETDTSFPVLVEPAGRVDVLSDAIVLAGERIGFVRVAGVSVGEVTLQIGDASMRLRVEVSPSGAIVEARRPRIATPVDGAAVWGGFSVGVEVFDAFGDLSAEGDEVRLRLPGGVRLSPISSTPRDDGPHRWFTFAVDADQLPVGRARLVGEVEGVASIPQESRAIEVAVHDASSLRVWTGEAETDAEAPRPARAGGSKPLLVRDEESASGGKVVVQNSAGRSVAVEVPLGEGESAAGGWHQVMLRAGGTSVSGLPPAVGVFVDAENRAAVMGSLAGDGFHRVAVGKPFWLGPAEEEDRPVAVDRLPSDYTWPAETTRVLTMRFENDFSAGRGTDRNLWIDRYEVARLPGPAMRRGVVRSMERVPAGRVRGMFAGLDLGPQSETFGGPMRVEGFVGGLGSDEDLAGVELWLNGEVVAESRSAFAVFWVTPSQMRAGENTLVLSAEHAVSGEVVRSVARRWSVDSSWAEHGAQEPRVAWVVSPVDGAWADSARERVARTQRLEGRPALTFLSNGHADLELPADWSGPVRVEVEAFGDGYEGRPRLALGLLAGLDADEAEPVKAVDVGRWPAIYELGTVALPAGPKALRLSFVNDLYGGKADQDRNLFVGRVTVWQELGALDRSARVSLLYPRATDLRETRLGLADALVAEVSSVARVSWAEAVVDGRPTGLRFAVRPGASRVLVPLVLREWATLRTGPLRVALQVGHKDDVLGVSESVEVGVLGGADSGESAYAQAVAWLDRVGFGPEPGALADVLVEGRSAYLDRMLSAGFEDEPGLRDAWLRSSRGRLNEESRGHLVRRAAAYLLRSPNPVRARLAMWTDNHFSTWWVKATPADRLADYAAWLELGAAPWSELLMASATSPAMLRYLDQTRSFANRLNENYAREIMELHTVGVAGGYDQDDVTRLAKLLTGWRFDKTARADAEGRLGQFVFRYLPQRNLPEGQVVLGHRFAAAEDPSERFDRARSAVELLAAHPATAEFVSAKLVGHYAGLPADETLKAAAVAAFHRSGGDLREVVRAIVLHADFLDQASPRRLAHPVGFAVRLQRLVGATHENAVVRYADQSGFGLFDRDTPDGYPEEDDAYADSNATLQRWRYAGEVAGAWTRRLPPALAYPGGFEDEAEAAAWRQSLVDHLAVMITGGLLSERSNRAALDVLGSTEASGWSRNRLMAQFIAQLPESALR